jgi:hypothetical protein
MQANYAGNKNAPTEAGASGVLQIVNRNDSRLVWSGKQRVFDLRQTSYIRLTANLQHSNRLFAIVSVALGLNILRSPPGGLCSARQSSLMTAFLNIDKRGEANADRNGMAGKPHSAQQGRFKLFLHRKPTQHDIGR